MLFRSWADQSHWLLLPLLLLAACAARRGWLLCLPLLLLGRLASLPLTLHVLLWSAGVLAFGYGIWRHRGVLMALLEVVWLRWWPFSRASVEPPPVLNTPVRRLLA